MSCYTHNSRYGIIKKSKYTAVRNRSKINKERAYGVSTLKLMKEYDRKNNRYMI